MLGTARYPLPGTRMCCTWSCRWLHPFPAVGQTTGPRPAPILPDPILALRCFPNSLASGPNPKIHYEFGSSPTPPYKFLHLGTLSKWNIASRNLFVASDKIFSELPKLLGQLYGSRLLSTHFHFLPHASAPLPVTGEGCVTLLSFHLTFSVTSLSSFPE